MAWRSTARDFSIRWEDIVKETGLAAEDMDYLLQMNSLQTALS